MWEIFRKIFFTFLTRKTKKNLEQILAGRFSHTIRAYRPVVCKGSFRLCMSEKNPHTRNLPAVSNRNQEVATCTKTKPKTLRVRRAQKQGNAPDFRQKQPKAGAFQVLEGKMAVETGCQQVRKDIQGPMEDYNLVDKISMKGKFSSIVTVQSEQDVSSCVFGVLLSARNRIY